MKEITREVTVYTYKFIGTREDDNEIINQSIVSPLKFSNKEVKQIAKEFGENVVLYKTIETKKRYAMSIVDFVNNAKEII